VPTYQYACTECQHCFEQVQSFSDDALTVCPQCQGRLRKVYNAVGVVFKGSGFYRNDSRAPDAAASESKPAGDGAASGDGAKKDSGGDTGTPTPKPSSTPAASTPASTPSTSGTTSGGSTSAA